MDKNKDKIKEIKSFCKNYLKGFASIISEYGTSSLDIDLLALENIFVQSIDSIGRILSSNYVIGNDIHLKQFGLKHFSCVQYISSILINIIDLPILFPKVSRLAAIRQVGKIVSRAGWLKDQKYQKVVYSTAKNFLNRIQISSIFSSDFECAYLFALSHMAVDTQLQSYLLKAIESYIPLLTNNILNSQSDPCRNINDIKISICKAVQKLDQPTDQLFKIMKSIAENKSTHPKVSSEASLALLCMSIKSNKRDYVKKITSGLSDFILSSEQPSDIKSAIKMLYNICSNYPSQKNDLLPILVRFLRSGSPVHRDYALYILTRLEIELNHKEYIEEIADVIKTHFAKRIKNMTNSNDPNAKGSLLKYVEKAASLICTKYIEYAAEMNDYIDILLKKMAYITSSIIDIKLTFTEDEIKEAAAKSKPKKKKQKKKKEPVIAEPENDFEREAEMMKETTETEAPSRTENKTETVVLNEKDDEINIDHYFIPSVNDKTDEDQDNNGDKENVDHDLVDPFEDYEPDERLVSPNTLVVFTWRRELSRPPEKSPEKLPTIVSFDIKIPGQGYSSPTQYFSQLKGFQIYEDVVAHFVLCCAFPDKLYLTIDPFFQHLADQKRATGRNPVGWEEISNILDKYSVLNYIQLFFALCLMQQQKHKNEFAPYLHAESDVVKELLTEMNQVLDLIETKKKEKNAKRVPTATETPPPKSKTIRY